MKWNNQETKKTVGKVANMQKRFTRTGAETVTITLEDRTQYSSLLTVWERQHIDIEDLNAGDILEITYVENIVGATIYRNFVKVVKLNTIDEVKNSVLPF